MEHSVKVGLCFGLTSGVITTLGLLVGLSASTNSTVIVLGGIIMIAIADAFSDAFGIHISEESENKHTQKEIWTSTISTFLFKFFCALTFAVPVFLFDLGTAVIVSVVWGLLILSVLSYYISKDHKTSTLHVIAEHISLALVVVFIANCVGMWIAGTFV
ncbi:MAG: VIT1/CCC1 transporter family protein [Candidatus Diapherotrites archaeon]